MHLPTYDRRARSPLQRRTAAGTERPTILSTPLLPFDSSFLIPNRALWRLVVVDVRLDPSALHVPTFTATSLRDPPPSSPPRPLRRQRRRQRRGRGREGRGQRPQHPQHQQHPYHQHQQHHHTPLQPPQLNTTHLAGSRSYERSTFIDHCGSVSLCPFPSPWRLCSAVKANPHPTRGKHRLASDTRVRHDTSL